MKPADTDAKRLAAEMGRRLQFVRKALGLTTTELAADLGLNEATIRYIEKGRRGPSVPLISTLCHLLKITPQYLFYGDVRDIDPELREVLVATHPELRWQSELYPAGKRSSARTSNRAYRARTRARVQLTPG